MEVAQIGLAFGMNTSQYAAQFLTDVKLEQVLLASSAISSAKDVHSAIYVKKQVYTNENELLHPPFYQKTRS